MPVVTVAVAMPPQRRVVAEDVLNDERPDRDGRPQRRGSHDLAASEDAEHTPLKCRPIHVVDSIDGSGS